MLERISLTYSILHFSPHLSIFRLETNWSLVFQLVLIVIKFWVTQDYNKNKNKKYLRICFK
jgi:hypothetical protein